MTNFCRENDASRAELNQLIDGVDVAACGCSVGSTWTVATSLCHLAFWDQRSRFLLKEWQKTREIETLPLDSCSIDSINQAVNAMALEVPAHAALRLASDSAAAVDAVVAEIDDVLPQSIQSAGFERCLRRSLHRREHLEKLRTVLAAHTAETP